MNDFSEIEAELKKLRPAPVSPELAARVECALAQTESNAQTAGVTRRRREWNWLPLGLGLAAATAAFLVLARVNVDRAPQNSRNLAIATPVPAPTAAPSTANRGAFVPSGLTQVVYSTRDEGLHFRPGADRPVRRIRSQKTETLQWKNPQTGASLRVTYPSEEVTLKPISGQ